MDREFKLLLASFLWCIVVVFAPGCGGSHDGPEVPSPATSLKLKSINLGYCNFSTVNRRAPANIEEFATYLVSTVFPESQRKVEEECLQQLKQGEFVVVWNQRDVSDEDAGTTALTAYEKKTLDHGGFVVFADGRVERKTPAELQRILKAVVMADQQAEQE